MYDYNSILKLIIENNDFKKEISTLKERVKKIHELREVLMN